MHRLTLHPRSPETEQARMAVGSAQPLSKLSHRMSTAPAPAGAAAITSASLDLCGRAATAPGAPRAVPQPRRRSLLALEAGATATRSRRSMLRRSPIGPAPGVCSLVVKVDSFAPRGGSRPAALRAGGPVLCVRLKFPCVPRPGAASTLALRPRLPWPESDAIRGSLLPAARVLAWPVFFP